MECHRSSSKKISTDVDIVEVAVLAAVAEAQHFLNVMRYKFNKFHFTVGVYDRNYDDENLDMVRRYMVLYQRPTTMLTDQCIYGVVYSEMCRFSRRCSRLGDFMAASRRMVGTACGMAH